ncbi:MULTISPECIES: GTP 3',8-cyclase MoaA [unclassified Niallia]|uniref:GTP 3',8-cyclase MoaA n=1 Tax=Niallia TaxID=2837506 RepID=UPI001EDC0B86|nr:MULTISPECIES: GTP 3',8-cyclase MoaA [unclassified Niallia]MCM3030465.1 GTP 3',8-cyclase MoaA [Niallia sp. MER 6]MDL0434611.1 GTP 3',8-cyclase MoaA [Niallia sp. SS-2023]UPO88423.1 GTP 3',8-cyclase MoaA [Niallia sp. Man26]
MKDLLNRPLRDLRISVIDRCNLRCSYCMPAEIFGKDYAFLPQGELLSFTELERLAKTFVSLGVEKIRLTGGEPLLRKDLHLFIEKLMQIDGLKDIALTTNGIFLPRHAKALKEAGLQRVNISLDSLNDELFGSINGRNVGTNPVKKGIEAAKGAGLGVKINMVVKKGLNESEIIPMAKFCREEEIELRFIEYMDVGSTNGWKWDEVVSKKEIIDILKTEFELIEAEPDYYGEVAKKYLYKGSSTYVGFITSVTESFCSSCTRSRISADGKLYTCLFNGNGHDLKSFIRNGAADEELLNYIKSIWQARADRYSDLRTAEAKGSNSKIEMSYIGG